MGRLGLRGYQKMLAGNKNFLVVTQNGGKIVGVVKALTLRV
jgi:hypothetical protein